ncbi:hypothetical protein NCCP2140_24330 [Pseudoalteromonas sp. NCCP-2140]|nr:hypothetical protein NCCP2140_24330 [Pseudoalteromonas sp. NCCP-2140]
MKFAQQDVFVIVLISTIVSIFVINSEKKHYYASVFLILNCMKKQQKLRLYLVGKEVNSARNIQYAINLVTYSG